MSKPTFIYKHKKAILLSGIVCLLVAAAIILYLLLSVPQARKDDFKRIASEKYDTVFLSMYSIENYEEESFSHFRGQTMLKTAYCIPDIDTLQSYMEKIALSGNAITTIYLGIRPESIDATELLLLLQEYPSVQYHIFLAAPSMDYWTALSDKQLEEQLSAYRSIMDTMLPQSNITVYHFATEWVLCNPANYENTHDTIADISRTLMLIFDSMYDFRITPENIEPVWESFSQLIADNRNNSTIYPDLSDYTIVFFGDSVIGNYTDSTSIPGVVNGLTNARVYNCGYGGNSAAYYPDAPINLPGIVDAFIRQDISPLPEDAQVYSGVTEYLQNSPDTKKLCFVINYGLNDYFIGASVTTEDPYDVTSYSGALRTAIHALQEAYPEAQILLMTPNFTICFSNGEERNSGAGGILTDYVNAAIAVGADTNVDVLDNYSELNIEAANYDTYLLLDGCHPNERTRFTIGSRIALAIR